MRHFDAMQSSSFPIENLGSHPFLNSIPHHLDCTLSIFYLRECGEFIKMVEPVLPVTINVVIDRKKQNTLGFNLYEGIMCTFSIVHVL